jgi:hypothetical protein
MGETRKLAAILVADVVGYSRLAGADEGRTLSRLRGLRSDLIDPAIDALTWPRWTRSGSMTTPSWTRNLWPRRPRLVGRPIGRTSRAYSALPGLKITQSGTARSGEGRRDAGDGRNGTDSNQRRVRPQRYESSRLTSSRSRTAAGSPWRTPHQFCRSSLCVTCVFNQQALALLWHFQLSCLRICRRQCGHR